MTKHHILACALIAAAALTTASAVAKAPKDDTKPIARVLLFDKGDDGSKFYRIPAIVTTNKGTLVAVADKRIEHNGDLPAKIDVVVRRSSDGGKTWTPIQTIVKHNHEGGYGDPALVVDKKTGHLLCIATHGEGLNTANANSHARIVVMRSTDDGHSWSTPQDITASIFTNDPAGNAPIKGVTAFATSGRALQLKSGRLMFVLVVRHKLDWPWTNLRNYAIYSDDHGHSWTCSGACVTDYGDEAKVAQLSDGRVLMSIRNPKRDGRMFSISTDEGLTWSPCVTQPQLTDPACNGDLISAKIGGRQMLLHTICDDPKDRRNVTLFGSYDNGENWTRLRAICPTGSAYSSITVLRDGSIGTLVEEDAPEGGGFQLWFTRFKLPKR